MISVAQFTTCDERSGGLQRGVPSMVTSHASAVEALSYAMVLDVTSTVDCFVRYDIGEFTPTEADHYLRAGDTWTVRKSRQTAGSASNHFVRAVPASAAEIAARAIPTVAAASEAVVGLTGTPADVISLTPTLDTSAYADGDLLFDATELANFVRAVGRPAIIQSLTVTDKDDQGVAFDLFSAFETVDFGTVNSAPSISDADAAKVQRVCRVEATDYIDLGGVRSATVAPIGLMVEPAADSRSIYFAAVTRGAPTYTAAGLVLRFGVIWL